MADRKDRGYTARPCGQDNNHVRQKDRLVEIVSDEHDCLLRRLPQIEHGLLHAVFRLDIQSAERLVHEQHVRRVRIGARQVDAKMTVDEVSSSTRVRIPPESSLG